MSLRVLCAAVAMAIGIGQAADAATVGTYHADFTVTRAVEAYNDYNGTSFLRDLSAFWGANVGQTVLASVSIEESEGGSLFATLSAFGKRIFGGNLWVQKDGSYRGGFGTSSGFFEVELSGTRGSVSYGTQDGLWIREGDATFDIQPAPVPLPASAALLPLGIGAFAVLRKRRRAVS